MKKFLAFITVVATLILALASCTDDGVKYEDVTYRENGIEFTLPSNMRRSTDPTAPYTFSTPEVVFTAEKLSYDALSENGVEIAKNFGAKEYVDIVTANLDGDQLYLTEDAENSKYTFRYTVGETEETEAFYYVVVVGTSGNVWEVTMSCYQDVSSEHIASFEIWAKYISTYSE
jgi:hypothetical protein